MHEARDILEKIRADKTGAYSSKSSNANQRFMTSDNAFVGMIRNSLEMFAYWEIEKSIASQLKDRKNIEGIIIVKSGDSVKQVIHKIFHSGRHDTMGYYIHGFESAQKYHLIMKIPEANLEMRFPSDEQKEIEMPKNFESPAPEKIKIGYWQNENGQSVFKQFEQDFSSYA